MSFTGDPGLSESMKKREYLKQQQQLRNLSKTGAPISADDMIENLLSKKEIFQRKKETVQSKPNQVGGWPSWLISGREPALYREVWTQVALPNGLAETTKLSNLLLTSRLTTDTLGYIWSLTNLTVPGFLTQHELYISLALVALAQSGYTFTSGTVVRQLADAPLPRLDLNWKNAPAPPPQPHVPNPPLSPSPTSSTPPPSIPTVTQTLSLLDLSPEPRPVDPPSDGSPLKTLSVLSATDLSKNFPSITSFPEPDLRFRDFGPTPEDDFDDFKSADIFSNSTMTSLTVQEVRDTPLPPPDAPDPVELFPECPTKSSDPEPTPLPQLDVPHAGEDKYSALRMLDSASEPDEFGDFLTAVAPSQPSKVALNSDNDIQLKCLEACIKLLKEAAEIFESIEDPAVVKEVASDSRGKAYLEEILEVERIGRRIRSTRESSELITEFESFSKTLQPYTDSVKNNHMDQQEGPKCGICLVEDGPAHVKYGINHFHAPCANLYLHMVDPILPIAPVM